MAMNFDIKTLEKHNKIIRAAILKIRFADLIFKFEQQILGIAFDEEEMKKKVELWNLQLQEEKVLQRKREIARLREEARNATTSMKRTVEFNDADQPERDLKTFKDVVNRSSNS